MPLPHHKRNKNWPIKEWLRFWFQGSMYKPERVLTACLIIVLNDLGINSAKGETFLQYEKEKAEHLERVKARKRRENSP